MPSRTKYKAVVLQKLGGSEDLYSSREKFNKEILYYSCPRRFFDIFNDNKDVTSWLYCISNDKAIKFKKIIFLKILSKLKVNLIIFSVLTFAIKLKICKLLHQNSPILFIKK